MIVPPPLKSDPAEVRACVEAIHTAAAAAFQGAERPGMLQLVRIHPLVPKPIAYQFRIGDVDGMVRQAILDADNGFNVYIEARTVSGRSAGRGNTDATRGVFAFVVDADADKGKAGIKMAQPSMVVETSPGNTHQWIFLDRALTPEQAKLIGAALRKAAKADTATGVLTQPYRVAGTPNYPTKVKLERGRTSTPTRILEQSGRTWTADELRTAYPEQPDARASNRASARAPGRSGIRSDVVEGIVAEAGKDRSARFYAAVQVGHASGMMPDDLEEAMRCHPQGCAGKYLHPYDRLRCEVERAWDKVEASRQGGREERQERQGRRQENWEEPKAIPLHWHRDAQSVTERTWLVRDLLSTVGKGLLSGQWGSAKTFIALDLSRCVMTGEPFAGRPVLRRGGVLFIAPEGAFEIPVRLKGLVAGKLAGAVLAKTLTGAPAVDPGDLPFAWIEECPRLVEPAAVEQLKATAEVATAEMEARYGLPLVLIIIDTVAAGAGFDDENSAAETQKVMNALERLSQHTGAFVLGVDHFGKAVETGTRGSSAKEAAADTVLAALGSRDEAGNVSNLRLAVRKVRGAPTGAETPYTLEIVEVGQDRWGVPITTCIVNWQTSRISTSAVIGARERWPTSLKVFREALNSALDEHGKRAWPYGAEGHEQRAVPLERVRDAFYAVYPADADDEAKRGEAKRKAFNRALKLGLNQSLIASMTLFGVDHLWVKPEPKNRDTHAGRTGHS